MNYWLGYSLIVLLGITIFLLPLIYLRRRQLNWRTTENLLLLGLSLFITLMGVEFYFKLFFAQSDGFDTLARENWRDRYYDHTFNSFNFRDQEWTAEKVAGKTKVMVVGDSFVEGFGINDPADRFPDLLADMLGPEFVVFNLGKRGAGTREEMEKMAEYPFEPDILVWTYFINDIDDAARDLELDGPQRVPAIPPRLEPLVENSYAFNFVYWRLYRLSMGDNEDERWQWRQTAFDDPVVGEAHRQDLLSIHQQTVEQGIPLIVVVFPDMVETEATQYIAQPIIDLFRAQDVPVLDVTPLIADLPPADRIVNSVDVHPNELVHARVATALYERFVALGLTSPESFAE